MTNTFLYQDIKHAFPHTEPAKIKSLEKLGIKTINDILYFFPKRYESASSAKLIEDLVSEESVTIYGTIEKLETGKSFKSKIPKAEGVVVDSTGKVKVTWLHQPYIAKIIKQGSLVKVHGKVTKKGSVVSMLNPEIEMVDNIPDNIGDNLFSVDYGTGENLM
jgi:ATP-dependent DNA helicase RecG